MKNLLSGFLGGILGAVFIAGGFVYANNNHYVGFNPATGANMIPVSGSTASPRPS